MAPHPSSPQQSLTFIRPSVLQRLANGDFVAQRQSSRRIGRADDKEKDRRELTSPLAVLKQCLPLNASVFTDRRQELLDLGALLNQPQTRLLAVEGHSGMGKSSLIRGLIELMGGGLEQALWVDATYVRTDSGMATFLVEALQFLSEKVTPHARPDKINPTGEPESPDSDDPMVQLQHQLKQLTHHPIAVIIDHVEHLLNDRRQFDSPISHELIGFLQTLPNIAIILSGHTLPANLNQYTGVAPFLLGPLSHTQAIPLWQRASETLGSQPALTPKHYITEAWNQCNPTQAMLATVLTALRHPVTLPQLHQLLSGAQAKSNPSAPSAPSALQPLMDERQCFNALKQAPYKHLLKRSVSPQRLLELWQAAQSAENPTITAEDLLPDSEWHYQWYDCAHTLLEAIIPTTQLRRYHQKLAQYYMGQRTVTLAERLLPVANSSLIHQARWHLELADELKAREETILSRTDADLPEASEPPTATTMDADFERRLDEQLLAQQHMQNPSTAQENQTPTSTPAINPISAIPTPTHITVIQSPAPISPIASGLSEPVVSAMAAPNPLAHPASKILPEDPQTQTKTATVSWLAQQLQQARQHQAQAQWEDAALILHNMLRHCQTTETQAQWWQCMGHAQLAQGHLSQWQLMQARKQAQSALALAKQLYQQTQSAQQKPTLPGPIASLFMQCGIIAADCANQQQQPQDALDTVSTLLTLTQPEEETTAVWHSYLAQVHFQAALAHDALNDPDLAQRHYQQAIVLLKQHQHWEPLSAASVNLGCLLLENQQTASAIPVLEEALNVEEVYLKRPAEWVDTLRLLAQAHVQQHNYVQAVPLLQQALHLAKHHQRTDWTIGTFIDLGHTHHAQQHTREAQHFYQQAQQVLQHHLAQHPTEAPLYQNWQTQLNQWLGIAPHTTESL